MTAYFMGKRKIVLLINCFFLLVSILFINSKGDLVIFNKPSEVSDGENSHSSEVLSQNSDRETSAFVTRVIDGDTIELENGEKVRYIGIDSPEVANIGECFGKESTNKNAELVLGKKVHLVKDVSERDRYQRLLRYVYVDDVFINELLVRDGYASALTYPPDVKFKDVFLEAQRLARDEGKGLWSKCK